MKSWGKSHSLWGPPQDVHLHKSTHTQARGQFCKYTHKSYPYHAKDISLRVTLWTISTKIICKCARIKKVGTWKKVEERTREIAGDRQNYHIYNIYSKKIYCLQLHNISIWWFVFVCVASWAHFAFTRRTMVFRWPT